VQTPFHLLAQYPLYAGDKDLIVTGNRGHIAYYQNTGSLAAPNFQEIGGSGNPFSVFGFENLTPYIFSPHLAFGDIDGDGMYSTNDI
jgi:hypothetical protein